MNQIKTLISATGIVGGLILFGASVALADTAPPSTPIAFSVETAGKRTASSAISDLQRKATKVGRDTCRAVPTPPGPRMKFYIETTELSLGALTPTNFVGTGRYNGVCRK